MNGIILIIIFSGKIGHFLQSNIRTDSALSLEGSWCCLSTETYNLNRKYSTCIHEHLKYFKAKSIDFYTYKRQPMSHPSSPLSCWNCLRKLKSTFSIFDITPLHWKITGWWTAHMRRKKTATLHPVNIASLIILAMEGSSASASMVSMA